MEFLEYMRVLHKRMWIVIGITLLFGVIGLYYNYGVLRPIYVADAKIYVGKEPGQDSQTILSDLLYSDKLAKDYQEIVKSRMVTGLAAKKLNNDNITPDRINDMINVDLKTDTHILVINAEAANPTEARDVANVVADVFQSKIGEFMQFEDVSIIDKAVTPISPAKPDRSLNTVIMTLIGFVAALVLIFTMEYMDNTIETPSDIEQHLGLPLLGVVPTFRDSVPRRYYGYY